jgi:hypothetical protein
MLIDNAGEILVRCHYPALLPRLCRRQSNEDSHGNILEDAGAISALPLPSGDYAPLLKTKSELHCSMSV